MKKVFVSYLMMCITYGQIFLSCKKEKADDSSPVVNQPTAVNHPPVANAGTEQTIILPLNSVILDGSASSDPDNNIAGYSWTQISGPSLTDIVSNSSKKTQVNKFFEGVYQFELKVTDATGLFGKDTVAITVTHATVVSDCNSNNWTQLQYLPADEFFFAPRYWFNGDNFLMGIDSIVYAVSNKGRVWKYNAQTNTWVFISNFPEDAPAIPVVFSINGKGYCYMNAHCWQYTPSTNQWIKKADPPGGLSAPLVINGKVCLRNMNNQLVEYDPLADSYSTKNSCPATEPLFGSFVVNGYGFHIYNNGQCWQYDAANDKWQQKAGLNVQGTLYNTSSFGAGGSGYILGDLNLETYNFNEPMKLYRYDFNSNNWLQCGANNYTGNGAYHISAISFNEIAFVGLGYNNGDFNATDFWKFQ